MNSPLLFGEWLRNRRDGLGLTRKEFAERVGCSVSTLRKIEDGERRPSGQIAELIANSLDIPAAEHGIFVRVARGDLGTDRLPPASERVALPGISSPKTNLPILPTPLIGRQNEISELTRILRDPACRLLTLVGTGGIGKTRLAIETAWRIKDDFADGVYFVSLASANLARLITPAIADSIGFTFESASRAEPQKQLCAYLKEKQILLLADNLEHLLNGSGIGIFAELLASAPKIKLLTTSREALDFQGEWVFEVQGLPVPEDLSPDSLVQDTSVELFLQRARRAHAEFKTTDEDLPAILRICHLVDGIPLAVELAASWARALTCADIAREIERGLDFLSANTRDLPRRHRSMRAVFDHSWKLLSEEEQRVLLHLSVFHGGFTREAAQQVAAATLPALSALVSKSLVRRIGNDRYDLHELIRQYALDRLAGQPEVQNDAQERHARYFMDYFASQDVRLRSSAQRETLVELTIEMDNFRTAWDWSLAHSRYDWIEQTLRMFAVLYDIRGWQQEGLDTLGNAVNALQSSIRQSPDKIKQVALGHALVSRSLLATRLGQFAEAQEWLEQSSEILRPLNEPRVLVEAVSFLGVVAELTGNFNKAMEYYSEGLELAKAVEDRWYAAFCSTLMTMLTGVTQTWVKPEITHERLLSAMADWRTIGDPRFLAIVLNNLSWNALALKRYDEAQTTLEESVTLSRSIGDRYLLGYAYRGLGIVAQVKGDHAQALEEFQKSLAVLTELGARQDMARILAEMSRSIFAVGDYEGAKRNWQEALRLAIETKGAFIVLESLVGLAALQAKQGGIEQALECLLIVLDQSSNFQDTRDRATCLRSELEAQLTPKQIDFVQARARTKTLDQVVNEALNTAGAQ